MNQERQQDPAPYDRERVMTVLGRVRRMGGLPLTDAQKKQFQGWFRTIAVRGHTTEDFLKDPDYVSKTYRESFPNPMSRGQFIRAFMMYVTGLTNEEFHEEYPSLTRESVTELMKKVNAEANQEVRRIRYPSTQKADAPPN
jgi:hypothetical protein